MELPVFRLEDFSDVIEVRSTEEMRQRLKPFFPMTKGRPCTKIAKRLFTVWSHSGSKGKVDRLHKSYVPARWVKEISEYSGIPYEDLERSVVGARAGYGGSEVTFPQGFPVIPTEDHAWILGLFFSSGGIHNRKRGRTRYSYGRNIRFCVSDPIIEKLVEIGQRIGDFPHIYDPNIGVRDEMPRRTGIGNRRRMTAVFHSVTVEILAKFGLPRYSISVKDKYGWDDTGRGRVYSLRNIGLRLPDWIKQNDGFMHNFIEGYINGQKGASWAYSKPYKGYRVIECHVQVRIAGMSEGQTRGFLKKIVQYLKKLNITGMIHKMSYPNARLTCWFAFQIWKLDSLVKLFDSFEILRPDLRARLFLVKHRTPLTLKMQQELGSLSTVILGLILEKPRTFEEIVNLLRLSDRQTEKALQKLAESRVVTTDGHRYFVEIAIFNPSISSFQVTRLQLTEKEVIM